MRSFVFSLMCLIPAVALAQPTQEEIQTKAKAVAAGQGCTGERSAAQQAKGMVLQYQFYAAQARPGCTDGEYLAMGDAKFSDGSWSKQWGNANWAAGEQQYGTGVAKMISASVLWAQGQYGPAADEYASANANFLVGIDFFKDAKTDYDESADDFNAAWNYFRMGGMY